MTYLRKTLLVTATAITLGLAGTQAAQAEWYGHGPCYGGYGHGYYFNGHGDWHPYGWFDGYHAWHFYPGFYGVRPYYWAPRPYYRPPVITFGYRQ